MKRFLGILLAGSLAALSLSAGGVARMNAKTGLTLSKNGLGAVYKTAAVEPALAATMEQHVGPGWQGQLEEVQHWQVNGNGGSFINSGTDRRGVPVNWEMKADRPFIAFQLRNKLTMKTVVVKDNCLNPLNRCPGIPLSKKSLCEAERPEEVDYDVSMDVEIDFHPVVTATATATTAPITITINNVTGAAPLMMAGGTLANQYVVVRDQMGCLNLGWLSGGGTKIKIFNANVNVNENVNDNTNSNSNSNANSNSVHVGGEESQEPLWPERLAWLDIVATYS